MKSTSKTIEGVTINYTREGDKVYRMSYTENGNLISKAHVFGIGKAPYIRAYNRKLNITADEMELLNQVA